jgi:hypothetical protein
MIVLSRQLLPGCAEHGSARAALGIEAASCIGMLGKPPCDTGPAPARRLGGRGSATLAFCPRDGGSEELSGVLGDCPSLASNSRAGDECLVLRQQVVAPGQQLLY